MKMVLRYLMLFAAVGMMLPQTWAQSADLAGSGNMVRVMRHPDGTKSVYERQPGWRGMRCSTFFANGRLAAVNDYTEGKYGELVGCIIYDKTKKNVLYKVAYGYDKRARLVEERMYTPDKKLVQRVIYKYNANGERSKPLIISLNTGNTTPANVTPTMRDDVNAINREMRNRH